jgi:hypothetical protein
MTHAEINALEAGPDLDRLVAEACGIAYETNPNPSGLHDWRSRSLAVQTCSWCNQVFYGDFVGPPIDGCKPSPVLFSPSVDWNDVMFAAEKCGLFDDAFLTTFDSQWQVIIQIDGYGSHDVYVEHPSGPVAICRAILLASKP